MGWSPHSLAVHLKPFFHQLPTDNFLVFGSISFKESENVGTEHGTSYTRVQFAHLCHFSVVI